MAVLGLDLLLPAVSAAGTVIRELVSQGSRSPIANVCDANYTVVAKMPKRYLPRDTEWMGGVHDRLRRLGEAVMATRRSGPAG